MRAEMPGPNQGDCGDSIMYCIYKANKVTTGTTFVLVGEAATLAEALALCPSAGWGDYEIFAGAPSYHRAAKVRIAPKVESQDVPVEPRRTVALAG